MRRAVQWILVAVAMMMMAAPVLAGKVGFVEVERALVQVDEGKVKLAELEEWSKPRLAALEQQHLHVGELQQQILKQRNVTTADAFKRLEEEEREARRRFEDATRDYKRDLDARQNEALKEVARRINQVVTDYAQANSFDAVFILKSSMLIYLSDSVDLTDEVIASYNQKFPAGK